MPAAWNVLNRSSSSSDDVDVGGEALVDFFEEEEALLLADENELADLVRAFLEGRQASRLGSSRDSLRAPRTRLYMAAAGRGRRPEAGLPDGRPGRGWRGSCVERLQALEQFACVMSHAGLDAAARRDRRAPGRVSLYEPVQLQRSPQELVDLGWPALDLVPKRTPAPERHPAAAAVPGRGRGRRPPRPTPAPPPRAPAARSACPARSPGGSRPANVPATGSCPWRGRRDPPAPSAERGQGRGGFPDAGPDESLLRQHRGTSATPRARASTRASAGASVRRATAALRISARTTSSMTPARCASRSANWSRAAASGMRAARVSISDRNARRGWSRLKSRPSAARSRTNSRYGRDCLSVSAEGRGAPLADARVGVLAGGQQRDVHLQPLGDEQLAGADGRLLPGRVRIEADDGLRREALEQPGLRRREGRAAGCDDRLDSGPARPARGRSSPRP